MIPSNREMCWVKRVLSAFSLRAASFPGPDVHIVEMLSSSAPGGGAHCHSNPQPAPSTVGAVF